MNFSRVPIGTLTMGAKSTANFYANTSQLTAVAVMLFCSILLATPSQASGSNFGLSINTWVSGGYGRARITGEDKSPDMGQYIVGLDYGFHYRSLFIGAITDYRFLNQYSAENPGGYGNRRGTRFVPMAPSIAIGKGKWMLRLDYQTQGDYNLTYTNSIRQRVSYSKPKGYRLQLRKYLRSKGSSRSHTGPFMGFVLERVTFSETTLGDARPQALGSKLNVDQVGVTIGWGF